jgi:hypothetical protein
MSIITIKNKLVFLVLDFQIFKFLFIGKILLVKVGFFFNIYNKTIYSMKSWKEFNNQINESVNKNFIEEFMLDFGFFITLNLAKCVDLAIDEPSKKELTIMMQNFRKPIINGMSYTELIKDMNMIFKNPKMTSELLNKIREYLIYIEPRIMTLIKDSDYKNNWLNKIKTFKTKYKIIITK